MTPGEFKKIVQTMKSYGVSYVKMDNAEIKMTDHAHPVAHEVTPFDSPVADDADPIKHKVEQMTSLMKLSDTELVDQLFPDHTETDEIA